ncbi:hypothetical protein [Paraburkholderia sp. SIMBA_054]|uniref:hypothetical protein n=1 Tax=Paraburkholderia sp. SIMBA_054 TaxID=3085795 RepID=UPI003979E710
MTENVTNIQTAEAMSGPCEEKSLEQLVAERDALSARIRQQMAAVRTSELANARLDEKAAIENYLPVLLEELVKHLRMRCIAFVFHDGQIEWGSTQLSASENIEQVIEGFTKRGFSEEFGKRLADALLANMFDASTGLNSITRVSL